MWASYGYLKEDNTVILVNATGVFLQTLYILCFLYYQKQRVWIHYRDDGNNMKYSLKSQFQYPYICSIQLQDS